MALVSGSSPTSVEVSAIETALAAFVLVNPQTGVRTVDRNALREWLRGEMDTQYSWYCGADAATVKAAYDGYLWGQLETFIDKFVTAYESVKTSGGATFPSITVDKSANAAAVSQLQAEAKVQAAVIENHTMDAVARIENGLETTIRTKLIERYPETVRRNVETRAYLATWVSDWEEESAPSPVSALIDLDQNDTITVTMPAAPSGRNVDAFRLYRSLTGTNSAAFQFVGEQALSAGLAFTDDVRSDALGEVCPSITWAEPRADMQNLTGGANGIMAASAGEGQDIAVFCEPFVPYAWPREYEIPLEYPVVGIGVFGQTFVYLTRGVPYLISGADSATMSAIKLESNQACVSRRSIVSVGTGVVFASPDGLCLVDGEGVRLLTQRAYSRDAWQALNPATMFCAEHEGVVHVFHSGGALAVDMASGQITRLSISASAAFVDRVTDRLYVASGTQILGVYAGASMRTGMWRSKVFRLPQHSPMAWLVVESDFDAPVTVRIFVDGGATAWYSVTLTDGMPARLPPGRYLDWQIEVESQARVTSVMIASTTAELQSA